MRVGTVFSLFKALSSDRYKFQLYALGGVDAEANALAVLLLAFMGTIGMIAIAIGLIAFAIFSVVYVYRDAKRRGMNANLWLLIVLLTGLIGLIVYLIVRRDYPVQRY